MTTLEVIETVRAIMARTGLSYTGVAIAAGMGPTTVRDILRTREFPRRSIARRSFVRWADLNKGAVRRGDIRFID